MIEKDNIVYSVDHFKPEAILEAVTRAGNRHRYKLEKFLGGGATSVVWKAKDLSNQKIVAIKALKPEMESEYRSGLEDEVRVLQALWALEDQKKYAHAVPELFAVFEKPLALVMEFIPFPSVTSQAGFILPVARISFFASRFNDFSNVVAEYINKLRQFESIPSEFVNTINAYQETQLKLKSNFQNLENEATRWSQTVQRLSEKDLVEIGLQMCKLFALLHEEGRSYADFQGTNFRWDEKARQIKVLDWNVLTPQGKMDVPKDLARLAGLLFHLICGKPVDENGVSQRMLERWGGALWQQNISFALRYVLARALSSDPDQHYLTAYQPSQELLNLSQITSLGGALEQILYSYTRHLDPLIVHIGLSQQEGRVEDAAFFASIVRIRMKNEIVSSDLSMEFETLEESLKVIQANSSHFKKGQVFMEMGKRLDARDEFHRAVDDDANDLEAHRWLVLAESLIQVKDDYFDELWKEEYLVRGLDALKNENWPEARTNFERSSHASRILKADAALNENLNEAERLVYELQLIGASDARFELVDRLKNILDDIKAIKSDPDARIPYQDLLLKDWPQVRDWEKEVDTYYHRMSERQSRYAEHEGNL